MIKINKIFIVLVILSVSITGSSCRPKLGSVAGNVFWEYNKYVGNKPDAGAHIALYSLKDTSVIYGQCDILGNFRIDGVPVGQYVVIVRSKNTNASASDHLRNVLGHLPEIKAIARWTNEGLSFQGEYDNLRAKLDSSYMRDAVNGDYMQIIKERRRLEDTLEAFSRRALNEIATKVPFGVIPSPLLDKYYYTIIDVQSEKTQTVVVDFGITYI